DRRQPVGPDVPGVAEDPEWLLGGIPLGATGALLRRIRDRQRVVRRGAGAEDQDGQGEPDGRSGWVHAPDDRAVRSRREVEAASVPPGLTARAPVPLAG